MRMAAVWAKEMNAVSDRKFIGNHMLIQWHDLVEDGRKLPACDAPFRDRAVLVSRIGLSVLRTGTSAWRVREAMSKCSAALNMICHVNIGLVSLDITFIDEETCEIFSQSLSLPTTGVNTHRLWLMFRYLNEFRYRTQDATIHELHEMLDEIDDTPAQYSAFKAGLASAFACAAFTFLLGGGIIEMCCAFAGAGLGNWLKNALGRRGITLVGTIIPSVALAGTGYVILVEILMQLLGISGVHESGYICSMLFVIPGFPLITGGIDLFKLDMRSGLERGMYAILIIVTATLTGWVVAMVSNFHPADFAPLALTPQVKCALRLVASFVGVYGFSLMFNSTKRMAATAGCIGMIANTLRLELVDLAGLHGGPAAFVGALTAGIIASLIVKKTGFPRICLTVPSIVIMVPGLYIYRAVYNLGIDQIGNGALWLTRGVLIILALPLGLVCARLLTQKDFRRVG